MSQRQHADDLATAIVRAVQGGMTKTEASRAFDVPRTTVRNMLSRAILKQHDFIVPDLPDGDRTVEEIIEAKRVAHKHKRAYYEARNLIDVQVKLDGPIAIAHFGDPHLDDDGCDFDLFEKHCEIVSSTPGMFAGNIGDITNNWVGRLTALHAHQSTKATEAWKLAEWMFRRLPWLYVIAGNHDAWSSDRDLLKWIADQTGNPYINHGTRLRLNFPNGRHMVVNVAHDYKGTSQTNPVHGGMKKAMRWSDDIFVHGHKHHTGVGMVCDPATQRVSWVLRVDSYKVYDDYPKAIGVDETYVSPCIVTIINPYAKSERDKVLVCLDPEQAAFILTKMREDWQKTKAAKKK